MIDCKSEVSNFCKNAVHQVFILSPDWFDSLGKKQLWKSQIRVAVILLWICGDFSAQTGITRSAFNRSVLRIFLEQITTCCEPALSLLCVWSLAACLNREWSNLDENGSEFE